MLKSELEEKIKTLESELELEKQKPTGLNISHCNVDMTNKLGIEVAEAVKEGMIALQNIAATPSYGFYFENQNKE